MLKKIILIVTLLTIGAMATGCGNQNSEEESQDTGKVKFDTSNGTKKTNSKGEEVTEIEMEDGTVVEMQENSDK